MGTIQPHGKTCSHCQCWHIQELVYSYSPLFLFQKRKMRRQGMQNYVQPWALQQHPHPSHSSKFGEEDHVFSVHSRPGHGKGERRKKGNKHQIRRRWSTSVHLKAPSDMSSGWGCCPSRSLYRVDLPGCQTGSWYPEPSSFCFWEAGEVSRAPCSLGSSLLSISSLCLYLWI